MTKEEYIKSNIIVPLHRWSNIALWLGSLVIIALSLLDYLVTPSNFGRFLIYRIAAASLIFLLFLFNKKKMDKTRHHIMTIIAAVTVSTMVALMIARFGGHESPYFAGMILSIIFVIGLIPLNVNMSILASFIIWAIYLIPIFTYDTISNKPFFINANVFIFSSIFSLVLLRYLMHQRFVSELGLQYDISGQKDQLEKYSTQLEHLVAERTKELNKSNVMLNSLFDNANDGIMIMDRDGIILSVNQKACEIHGFEKDAMIGVNIGLLETEENKQLFKERKERILNGEALMFETQHYRKDGSKVSLEISSKAVEVEGNLLIQSFHRDITEKKRLQEQLFQSQKMESIGLLAGGIAHDFNNILTGILGHAEVLHEYSELDATSKQKVKTIENSARKAGQMVSKLLSFARKGNFEMQPLNLNDVAKDTIDLLGRMMAKKNIEIKMEFDNSIFPINGDANQLEQVIMNLVVNAGDAMSHGGAITIATSLAEFGNNASSVHPLLAPRKYVVLKISDTGTGIPDEIKNRIFDPFFTTKEPGKGTGLGLSMVYGIVKGHKGVINVKSQLGRGTTFEVYLPASDRAMHKVERVSTYSMTGRGKILVVDDDGKILSFIKDVLESQGYRVVVTDNPVYALDIFKNIGEEIDLVITDIVMPLVNGKELIRHFKRAKPNVKVIAISGYDIWNIGKRDKDINAYIRKPFEGIYLLSVVRKVLDAESTTLSMQRPM